MIKIFWANGMKNLIYTTTIRETSILMILSNTEDESKRLISLSFSKKETESQR